MRAAQSGGSRVAVRVCEGVSVGHEDREPPTQAAFRWSLTLPLPPTLADLHLPRANCVSRAHRRPAKKLAYRR